MKANKIEKPSRFGLVTLVGGIVFLLLAVGALVAYDRLRDIYLEQCVIRNMEEQVTITSGKMVLPGTIAEELGLREGVNLATIDFAKRREDLLSKVPNLRAISISRKLPDKLYVAAEERTPIARMNIRGNRAQTGRVVDAEGMVFVWQRGTQTLPTIREAQAPGTPKGRRVSGRTLAALRLVEVCHEPEFLELGVLEVDVSKHDFLLVTLGNYSKVKIAWNEMDEHTVASEADLRNRLANLLKAMRSRIAPETVIWNATMPDKIFADTQRKL